MSQAPTPPVSQGGGGWLVACEKPRQFQHRWWDVLVALPTQVKRPLRDALNGRLSNARRRAGIHHASRALGEYRRNAATYSESVAEMLGRRGIDNVDVADPEQSAAFVARIMASGLNALGKCKRAEAAIAYADMAIAWAELELGRGN